MEVRFTLQRCMRGTAPRKVPVVDRTLLRKFWSDGLDRTCTNLSSKMEILTYELLTYTDLVPCFCVQPLIIMERSTNNIR